MLTPVYTNQFNKDIKRIRKRGKNLEKFKIIAQTLLEGKKLDLLNYDHKLLGHYQDRRECHIEADWLLIYQKQRGRIIFERTGSHADLFE